MTACVWSECTVYVILMKASPIFLLLASRQSKASEREKERLARSPSLCSLLLFLPCCRSCAQEAPSPVRGAAIVQTAVWQLASAGYFCQVEKIIVKNKGSKVKWNNESDRRAWLQVKFLHNTLYVYQCLCFLWLGYLRNIKPCLSSSCLLSGLSCNCNLILTALE